MEKLEKYDYSIEYHANVVRKTSKRENLHIIIRWYFPRENNLSSAAYRSYRTENNWTKHLFQFSAASFQKN